MAKVTLHTGPGVFEVLAHVCRSPSEALKQFVENAADAIGDKTGAISVTAGSRSCDSAFLDSTLFAENLSEGPCAFIEVADSGAGMDEKVLSKIFDPFFSTKFNKRGLGLSTVLGVLRGHRGAIRVESRPGSGSTFTMLFPVSQNPAASGSDSASTRREP